ncbi:hypothetical protein SO694_00053161 [Aureococcus anophagefferens]|uniref:Tudor domain-containing protein n=1 Tax=Aureococcus anophagefferens TaxID=44056 RepID=A0ABR1FY70_AURAN
MGQRRTVCRDANESRLPRSAPCGVGAGRGFGGRSATKPPGDGSPRVCRVGDAVEALWPEDEEWYNATIVAVAPDGRLSLAYEDGDFRDDGLPSEVRHLAPEAPVAPIAVAGGDDDDGLGDILDGILDAPTPSGAVVPPAPLGPAPESEALRKLSSQLDDGLGDLLDGLLDGDGSPRPEPPAPAPEEADDDDDDYDDDYEDAQRRRSSALIRGRRGRRTVHEKRREHKQTHGAATALQARIRGRKGRRTVLEQRGASSARAPRARRTCRLLPEEPAPPRLPAPIEAAPRPRSPPGNDGGGGGLFALTALGAENDDPASACRVARPAGPGVRDGGPRGAPDDEEEAAAPVGVRRRAARAGRPASGAEAASVRVGAAPPSARAAPRPPPGAYPARCWEGVKRWLDDEIRSRALDEDRAPEPPKPPKPGGKRRPARAPADKPPRPVEAKRRRDVKLAERGFDLRLARH